MFSPAPLALCEALGGVNARFMTLGKNSFVKSEQALAGTSIEPKSAVGLQMG
jgi:hypothetical protein